MIPNIIYIYMYQHQPDPSWLWIIRPASPVSDTSPSCSLQWASLKSFVASKKLALIGSNPDDSSGYHGFFSNVNFLGSWWSWSSHFPPKCGNVGGFWAHVTSCNSVLMSRCCQCFSATFSTRTFRMLDGLIWRDQRRSKLPNTNGPGVIKHMFHYVPANPHWITPTNVIYIVTTCYKNDRSPFLKKKMSLQ